MVKGTFASELRTRFCPTRFTYSVTTGSSTSFAERSTSWAYCLPIAISLSSPYKLTWQPTLRLPTASTSSLEFLGSTLSGELMGALEPGSFLEDVEAVGNRKVGCHVNLYG